MSEKCYFIECHLVISYGKLCDTDMQEITIYFQSSCKYSAALRNKVSGHPIAQHIKWICADQQHQRPKWIVGTPTAVHEGGYYMGDNAVRYLTEEMKKLS